MVRLATPMRSVARLVIPAVTGSLLVSLAAFLEVWTNGPIDVSLYRLLDVGDLVIDLGFYIDQLPCCCYSS